MLGDYIGNYSRREIERKFLLKSIPDQLPSSFIDIEDMYLPQSSLRLRLEFSPERHIVGRKLTKKEQDSTGVAGSSIMTSLYLSESDLAALGHLTGHRVCKRRYIQESIDHRIVYDVFKDQLEGLILAEVEFRNAEDCTRYGAKNSDWLEVTGTKEYAGGCLASLKNLSDLSASH